MLRVRLSWQAKAHAKNLRWKIIKIRRFIHPARRKQELLRLHGQNLDHVYRYSWTCI